MDIEDPTTCHKFFGKYDRDGRSILVCCPQRSSSCIPFIVIPEGTIAVVMTSGAFVCYANPGMYVCGPFTESTYLVSK